MTMWGRRTRFASSTRSLMGLISRPEAFGRAQPQETGRPGYAPADLLKLYIYAT